MNTTVRIARILSVYLIITGAGFGISPDFYTQLIAHTGTDPILINLSGMVHFFIGMTIIAYHFVWKSFLEIAVSLLGCLFLLKGIFLITIPELILQSGDNPAQIPWLMSTGFLLVGIILAYLSFVKSSVQDEED
ncbi:hypothetical protein D1013_02540 [Euzebyella marina]|uniref:Uncharacterized protein n=1 Tax=Euzebyella marina TaxID=1761453 RepID=A0A3G2L292_9FLAO|nr:hypothetical protein [Euzebyella marina]AYN66341.1 hypothetical protein D1013_02540 [Euzebyella marina]